MFTENKNWEINTRDRQCLSFNHQKEKDWVEPFFFIQGADCQFGLISWLDKDEVNTWEEEKRLSNALVERINQMNPAPKFFVICGDLVNAEQISEYRKPQEKDFKEIFGKIRSDIPVLCVCGNHDVNNTPTPITVQNYKSSFGDDYYSFYCGGILFVVINSQYFFDGSQAKVEADDHSKWFDEILVTAKKNKSRQVFLFIIGKLIPKYHGHNPFKGNLKAKCKQQTLNKCLVVVKLH